MIIKNAKVFEENGSFVKRDIHISGTEIAAQSPDDARLDAEGCYAIPGLIDIHLHGCVRQDFSFTDAAGLEAMALYQARQGVTALCPTLLTLPEDELAPACALCAGYTGEGADIVGVNLEGPFLSRDNAGAQNPAHMHAPDVAMFHRLQTTARGGVKLLSIAPEVPGAIALIDALRDEVVLSVAHTKADYDTAKAAFDHGAKQLTHLFNAMPPLLHRAPGVIGAASENENVRAELICDGVHVHPSSVRAAFRLFGKDRIILISDSMMATGLEDGSYTLGDLPVTVRGNRATLTEGGSIAGSVTNLMNCLRTAVQDMEVQLETAVACATVNPAKAIGIDDRYGSLGVGKRANIVLLRPDLSIQQVILRGEQLS